MGEKRDNSGYLGKNRFKEKESQPGYTGKATVGGVEYKVAAWLNEGENGKYFSLKFSLPAEKKAEAAPAETKVDFDDELPF